MYENKTKPLVSRKAFGKRILFHILMALALVVFTLMIGVVGHMYFDRMGFSTALMASVTLSSGLGLSVLSESTAGQLFTSLYGIFSGYVYIATSSIVIAPILHRVFHKLHLED